MIGGSALPGDPVCWPDDRGVWHHGWVDDVESDRLVVTNSESGVRTRVRVVDAHTVAPVASFETDFYPQCIDSRLFVHAVRDAVDDLDQNWSDIGLVRDDGLPTVTVTSADAAHDRDALARAVEERTPTRVSPEPTTCEVLQL